MSNFNAYYVIAVRVDHRTSNAAKVQDILTKHGCNIRTRVGLHEISEDNCSEDGFIILQACGEAPTIKAMMAEFEGLDGVRAQLMDLN